MNVVQHPLDLLREPPWNPNTMDNAILARLRQSIAKYGLVVPLVVRPLSDGLMEVLGGNQRFMILKELGYEAAPCVVVSLRDEHAQLLSQVLNHVHGSDDEGLRAELIRKVLEALPQEEVLAVLPGSAESLQALTSIGQQDMSTYLEAWQHAQAARLKHLQFQLMPSQLEVIEEALQRIVPVAKENMGGSPNVRGTALYLLCKAFLEREVAP